MLNKFLLSGFLVTTSLAIVSSANAMDLPEEKVSSGVSKINPDDPVQVTLEYNSKTLAMTKETFLKGVKNGKLKTNVGTFEVLYENDPSHESLLPLLPLGPTGRMAFECLNDDQPFSSLSPVRQKYVLMEYMNDTDMDPITCSLILHSLDGSWKK